MFKFKKNKQSSFNSADYWEKRYQVGGNSGAGSYGRLAKYKADFLNSFVEGNNISSVIEWGCGDGNQLSLASYPSYIGIDVSRTIIDQAAEKFTDDKSKTFIFSDPSHIYDHQQILGAELALSLDVIFHLVEDNVYENYMERLFFSASKYVIIYSSNKNEAPPAEHVKHRVFTQYTSKLKDWELVEEHKNPYSFDESQPNETSFANFYVFKKK